MRCEFEQTPRGSKWSWLASLYAKRYGLAFGDTSNRHLDNQQPTPRLLGKNEYSVLLFQYELRPLRKSSNISKSLANPARPRFVYSSKCILNLRKATQLRLLFPNFNVAPLQVASLVFNGYLYTPSIHQSCLWYHDSLQFRSQLQKSWCCLVTLES